MKRRLSENDKIAIREQLADGMSSEKISQDFGITWQTVAGLKAHLNYKKLSQEEMLERAYRYAYRRAKAKNEPVLSLEECVAIWRGQERRCALTGKAFSNAQLNKTGKILRYPLRPSLDRRSSSKPYVKSNVQIVTQWANFAKGEWGKSTFLKMCRAAADYKK